jgi:serine/threonine-protein kinase
VLLDGIDQHAVACEVDPEVFSLCQVFEDADKDKAASDGINDTAIASICAQEFKSTIFVPFSPGEFIPTTRTRVIKQLGSKPLCAVYLARNEDGRMVTVKQFYLADETEETKAFAKILRREYELLSRLDHPGIANVINSFTEDKSTYLVIEHRPGSDLRTIVHEHGARSESLIIAWAETLCEIMIYLHNREPAILHRDLTPDNLVVGEDGQLRLIDFGAAREFLEGITGTMIGKQCYVSPEQLRGEANQRSDIYSFGGTMYFLLTGRDPVALSQSSPAKNMDCSLAFDELIRDCTEFDSEKRPQSFEEVLKRLKGLDRGLRLKLTPAKAEAVA